MSQARQFLRLVRMPFRHFGKREPGRGHQTASKGNN
jgi:hypothetical protein